MLLKNVVSGNLLDWNVTPVMEQLLREPFVNEQLVNVQSVNVQSSNVFVNVQSSNVVLDTLHDVRSPNVDA